MLSVAPQHMRPAARSAAVRPHSIVLSSGRKRTLARSAASPWPGGCCASPGASQPVLFFRLSPRPVEDQGVLVAQASSQLRWEPGTVLVTGKALCLKWLALGFQVPAASPARIAYMRARTCGNYSLSLGTWELFLFIFSDQRLARFPKRFPVLSQVGTWEPLSALVSHPDRLGGRANKVEAGYGVLQLAGGGARRKFRSSIARIREQLTRRGGIGGFQPFAGGASAHIGRAMLEGCWQAADLASISGACRKLGRLTRRPAPGSPWAGRTIARERGVGTPNRAAASRGLPALHAGRILIENPFRRLAQGGPKPDGIFWTGPESAQTLGRRRGPGGASASNAAETALSARHRRAGERAGVKSSPAVSQRPHETGEGPKLRSAFAAVNCSREACCG